MTSADAEFMRDYRTRNPAYAERNARQTKARFRAYKRLADAHRAEFTALYRETLAEIEAEDALKVRRPIEGT